MLNEKNIAVVENKDIYDVRKCTSFQIVLF